MADHQNLSSVAQLEVDMEVVVEVVEADMVGEEGNHTATHSYCECRKGFQL